jgi:hypothetical protein
MGAVALSIVDYQFGRNFLGDQLLLAGFWQAMNALGHE